MPFCGVVKETGNFVFNVFITGKKPFRVDMRDVFERLDQYALSMAEYSSDFNVAMLRYADEITQFLVNAFITHVLSKYNAVNGICDEELGRFMLSMYRRRFIEKYYEALSMSFDCYVEEDGYDVPNNFDISNSELRDWKNRHKR